MKQIILFGLISLLTFSSHKTFSQTNTFPTSGNVGIGTISPGYSLVVNSTSGNNYIMSQRGSQSQGEVGIGINGGTSGTVWWIYQPTSSNNLTFHDNIADRITFQVGGNVGIGTTSNITFPLTIKSATDGATLKLIGRSDNYSNLTFYNGDGTTTNALIEGHSSKLSFYTGSILTSRMVILEGGNVGIGTNNPQNLLDVNGTVHAKEFKASLDGWSDYVFEDDYKLMTLYEVENYIKRNNKLPDIPSAKEVKKDGVNLGEMNALLLKKVEELTLYVIELNKKIEKLESSNNIKK
jgi:hypothetical protein